MATDFAGEDHAALYVKYRPKAASQVIDKVLEFLEEKIQPPYTSAVDVACGSGQSTEILGEHFKTVLGIDVSEAQVKEAKRANKATNIKYVIADAEHIPVPDSSVDLITCSQAAHWLDFPAFCKEVDRVLKPSGVLAVYARDHQKLLNPDKNFTEKLNELYLGCKLKTLAPYWISSVHPIRWKGYVDLHIPYPEFYRTTLEEYREHNLSEIIGRLKSSSAYQKFHEEHPNNDILTALQDKILETLQVNTSPDDTIIKSSNQIFLLLGRKPREN